MPAEGTGEEWTPAGIAPAALYAELARLQAIVDAVRKAAYDVSSPELERITRIKALVR